LRKPGWKPVAAIGAAVALFAALQLPYWLIPYHHSFATGGTRYLMIQFHHNRLPSRISRTLISSKYPGGRNFGKAYAFPALGKVEVMDYGSLDDAPRWIP
jgi:hypothetical protein